MASRTLDAWLGAFITHDMTNLVQWRRQLVFEPNVKQEPVDGAEYTHDYSNLRSHHAAAPAQASRLQLLEVLSGGDVVIAYVSDGETRIRARLHEEAVAVLEKELEAKLIPGVKGDVFQMEQFTVVCTHMGPTTGFVQLDIEQVEYIFHLRKIVGQPTPIEECKEVQALVRETRTIWNRENPVGVDSDSDEDDNLASQATNQKDLPPQISPTHNARPASSSGTTLHRNKRREMHLESDGLEILKGVNLSSPLLASMRPVTSTPITNPLKPVGTRRLLNLIGQQPKPMGNRMTDASQPVSEPVLASQIPFNKPEVPTSAFSPPQAPLAHKEGVAASTSRQSIERPSSSTPTQMPSRLEPASQHVTKEKTADEGTVASVPESAAPVLAASHSLGDGQNLVSHVQPASSAVASQPRIPYGRRKIPKDQMKLLDHPSSWFPSLPGYNFPVPNVPVELLKAWCDDLDALQPPTKDTQRETAVSPSRSISSDVSTTSSESDEEFSASQWPPSSPPKQPDLPPDSSIPSAIGGGSDNDELEMSVPRALTIRNSPVRPTGTQKGSIRHTPPPAPSGSIDPFSTMRQRSSIASPSLPTNPVPPGLPGVVSLPKRPLSPQPQPASRSYQAPLLSEHQSRREIRTSSPGGSRSTPAKLFSHEDRRSNTGFNNRPSAQETPPSRFQGHRESVRTSISAMPRSVSVPSAVGEATVGIYQQQDTVKNTTKELDNSDNDKEKAADDQSVPSDQRPTPLQDPSVMWKANRNAAFKGYWLKDSYFPERGGRIHLSAILAKYRMRFPDDSNATENDLLCLVSDAFPDFPNVSPSMTFRKLSEGPSNPSPNPPPIKKSGHRATTKFVLSLSPPQVIQTRTQPSIPDVVRAMHTDTSIDDPTPPSRQPVIFSSISLDNTGTSLAKSRTTPRYPDPDISTPVLARTPRHNRRLPPASSKRRAAASATSDIVPIFQVFHDQWRAIAPGGAFARPLPTRDEVDNERRRRIDVLTWDIS